MENGMRESLKGRVEESHWGVRLRNEFLSRVGGAGVVMEFWTDLYTLLYFQRMGEFPSSPLIRSLCSHCREHGLDSRLGNSDPASHQDGQQGATASCRELCSTLCDDLVGE